MNRRIGIGQTSDDSYIVKTNEQVKSVNPNILMMQGAGIMNERMSIGLLN